jgi:6-pyruvoyltetrahydropterin/6-carboxytetrahydropterin synthase
MNLLHLNKTKMQITRKIVFHAGHMLKDDDSKCYHPHGHEYVVECTIEGQVKTEGSETGMVMNFGGLKELMMKVIHDKLDHKFIIELNDPRYQKFIKAVGKEAVFTVGCPPTAENLVKYFYRWVVEKLPEGIEIHKIRLQETLNCWVEYEG